MKVLIIGSGGREHALAWQCAKFDNIKQVYVAPGNAGSAMENKINNIAIASEDITSLIKFAKNNAIDITIVGPEAPLTLGIVDEFNKNNLKIFGPSKKASQLEGSKSFCKDFLQRNNIPTASYKSFNDTKLAIEYVKEKGAPIVIKADGLAAGKGVIIAKTEQEAFNAIYDILQENRFGDAGSSVVIEEFLTGQEASFIVMTDGKNILPMATSQDHKARDNNDKGPNTGGMGAYSPAPVITEKIFNYVMKNIIEKTVISMATEGNPYTGFLYAGLMIDKNGKTKVLEYNCRFGDPETQPIMMRLNSNLANLCLMASNGELNKATIKWDKRACLGVVLAAKGYPEKYTKGAIIKLPENTTDSKIFHAGTTFKQDNIISNGGRVLCATALGEDIKQAQKNAYKLVDSINWQGSYYRTDIGYKAI